MQLSFESIKKSLPSHNHPFTTNISQTRGGNSKTHSVSDFLRWRMKVMMSTKNGEEDGTSTKSLRTNLLKGKLKKRNGYICPENRFRTEHGRCYNCMDRWGIFTKPNCECEAIQTNTLMKQSLC